MLKKTENSFVVDFENVNYPCIELHKTIDNLRSDGPVVPIYFMGAPSWLILDYSHVKQGFRDNFLFPPDTPYKIGIEPVIGETFQSMEGERHRIFRKLATPTFQPRSIEKLDSDILAEVANELIHEFINNETVDLVKAFNQRYPFVLIARLLGIPKE